MTVGVSVVLLTLNAARHLKACLDSLTWADEIIALDGGSTDDTLAMLSEVPVRIYPQPFDMIRAHGGNFDVARNLGFSLATQPWTLVVDADEVVSPSLRDEILQVSRCPASVAYEIPRVNLFWGRPSRILGDDLQLRLFPKGAAHYEGLQLDARPRVSCPVQRLCEPLVHHQADTLTQLLRKLHSRTAQRARVMLDDPSTVPRSAILEFYWHFRYYYRTQGRREGLQGLGLAAYYAAYPALTQVAARRLARARKAA
jgi:hypothetical protein